MGKNPQKVPQHYSKRKLQPTYKPTNTRYIQKYSKYIYTEIELKILKTLT